MAKSCASGAAIGWRWAIAMLNAPGAATFAWAAIALWRGLARRPVAGSFLAAAVVTLVGYVVWGAMNGWTLPEFTDVLKL